MVLDDVREKSEEHWLHVLHFVDQYSVELGFEHDALVQVFDQLKIVFGERVRMVGVHHHVGDGQRFHPFSRVDFKLGIVGDEQMVAFRKRFRNVERGERFAAAGNAVDHDVRTVQLVQHVVLFR